MKHKKYAEGGATAKPEKKSSGFKELLGTLSPLYGMLSGHGAFGKNDLGILPALARRARKRRADGSEMTEAEEAAEAAEVGAPPPTMRSGGSVKKFRKGGMPDLTGDGKVTRADVLKGRGVFRHGGRVKKMAEGGSPDVEADLQALKTLKQPDYDVGGPKRRYRKGKVKRYADEGYKSGGSVSSASKRADGCAVKGKTKGRFV